ncbi:NlpC/P60 family protein [Zhouia sp. PK063]|uniref:C40 family peptidase n=1 Tax=Zhouia sp. PK063 TaxID=3373602 RepID=UPI0037B33668
MQYGICNLNIVPLRSEPKHTAELISQMLYGEHFKVLEQRKYWSKIRIAFDKFEGWVENNQFQLIEEDDYIFFDNNTPSYASDLIEFVTNQQQSLIPITLGASVSSCAFLQHDFEGMQTEGIQPKEHLLKTAYLYLNSPFLWGGKTPFGIDSAGFTQMVYKLNGYQLCRLANEQAKQGEPLSFIEESEPGDLAFFDNDEGQIIHVGIIMTDNYIIHADGKVRVDRLDHTGIFNPEKRQHTFKLRVIKKII